MWMWRSLCLFGFHRRSHGRAQYVGSELISECSRCRIPMRRRPDGKWVVLSGG